MALESLHILLDNLRTDELNMYTGAPVRVAVMSNLTSDKPENCVFSYARLESDDFSEVVSVTEPYLEAGKYDLAPGVVADVVQDKNCLAQFYITVSYA